MSGTDVAYGAIVVCARYALSGTDIAYRATRMTMTSPGLRRYCIPLWYYARAMRCPVLACSIDCTWSYACAMRCLVLIFGVYCVWSYACAMRCPVLIGDGATRRRQRRRRRGGGGGGTTPLGSYAFAMRCVVLIFVWYYAIAM
eukprot:2137708-Rhodomonas_salina.1